MKKKKIASNVAKPCRFVNTERGCLKGDSCNFSHSKAAIAQHVKKVPKLCRNKETCVWKPQCRYLHPEDGESLPAGPGGQGFGVNNFSQQPPGWSSLPPPSPPNTSPTVPSQENQQLQMEQEKRTNVIEQFLKLIVPNLLYMTQFPNLTRKNSQGN